MFGGGGNQETSSEGSTLGSSDVWLGCTQGLRSHIPCLGSMECVFEVHDRRLPRDIKDCAELLLLSFLLSVAGPPSSGAAQYCPVYPCVVPIIRDAQDGGWGRSQ